MPDSHAAAVSAALKTGNELKRLFALLGSVEHQRGRILSAYRQARKAMQGVVDSPAQAQRVLEDLRIALLSIMSDTLDMAIESGVIQGHKELAAYEIPATQPADIARLSYDAAEGWQAVLDGQLSAIYSMILMGAADEAMLLGGADRVGMLTPTPVINEGSRWLGMAAILSTKRVVDESLIQADVQDEYRRQAIAAIDERTTDCCLRVHGQTTTLDGDFTLIGSPRFADKLHSPPFHWYCRTAVALVRVEDTDDSLTRQMQDAAKEELGAREIIGENISDIKAELVRLKAEPDIRVRKDDNKEVKKLRRELRAEKAKLRVEIHPAHARSRR